MAMPVLRLGGLALWVAGLLGIAAEAVIYLWPDQVPEGLFSNPFSADQFLAAQLFAFLHHLVLAVGLGAVVTLGWQHLGRVARLCGVVAVCGGAVWAITELVAISYADQPADEVNRGLVGTMFGVGCTLVGLGMIVFGVATLRAGVHHRVGVVALSLGAAEFLILTPGIVSGVDLVQHIAIAIWMALFAALGATVAGAAPAHVPATRPRPERLTRP